VTIRRGRPPPMHSRQAPARRLVCSLTVSPKRPTAQSDLLSGAFRPALSVLTRNAIQEKPASYCCAALTVIDLGTKL
jgi:hypothetical protein